MKHNAINIIIEVNQTDSHFPQNKTIHQLFEEQAIKTPDNIALVFEDKQLTYKQLNEKSNQLARYIQSKYQSITNQKLQPDTLIALYLDRSLEMIISILAVLKSGAGYVPISPDFPNDRTQYILDDTKANIVLSQSHLSDKLQDVSQNIHIISTDLEEYQDYSKDKLVTCVQPNNLAYVIYTSGTTGKPKGAMLEHKGVINRIVWMQSIYGLTDKDKVLQKTPYNFDVSVWELLWANWYGATIVIAKPDGHRDCDYLYNLMIKEKVTVSHFVPSMLDVFLNYLSTKELLNYSLQTVICSGEALSNNTCNNFYKLHQNVTLYNLYGPTEASIDVTYTLCESGKKVTIGKPIYNTKIYILDNNLIPVPIGVPGELYISGVGLARGYLNLTELTKESFIKNLFATTEDINKGYTRIYKTGDLCKWLSSGEIEYIGRNDFQVKLRGFRIELGEIENTIASIDHIQQSCVIVSKESLVAYYVSDIDIDDNTIQNHLADTLPEYMVPNFYMRLESFPLTINGKLDRKALPNFDMTNEENHVSPSTASEKLLCNIWKDCLDLEKVGITDNFFKIGGSSIKAIQTAYQMSKALDTEFSIADLFRYKTIQLLLNNVSNNEFQLIKYYSGNDSNKPKMIFIHPAFGGCEMYQEFIDRLVNDYNCIGIDNYNIYEKNKIDNLSKLSSHYINQLNLDKNETIYMFGWSLGGVIAVEMSYQLEKIGFKNIKAIILDSHFSAGRIFEHHPQFDPKKGGKIVDEIIAIQVANLNKEHVAKVLAAKDCEFKLGQTAPSGKLKHTEICFFRAMDNPGYDLSDNNLGKYSNNFGYIPIKGDHMQLMPQMINNWHKYQKSFITFDFSMHYQPIEIRKNIILELINKYKKTTFSICITIVAGSAYLLELFDFVIEPVALVLA